MGKLIDLAGKRFGFWVVQDRAINTKSGQVQWSCLCECGSVKLVTANSLRSGNSTSCGCNHAPDLTGEKFGQLTVVSQNAASIDKSRRSWNCLCDCGVKVVFSTYKLREEIVRSCGCGLLDKARKAIETSHQLGVASQMSIQDGILLIERQTKAMVEFNEEMRKGIALIVESRRMRAEGMIVGK
jgi:hypothetical protein